MSSTSTVNCKDIPHKPLFRPDEVATIFQVSVKTIYSWHNEGKLPGLKVGDKTLRFQRPVIISIITQDPAS
jgi:excisionase family DNA binding protein